MSSKNNTVAIICGGGPAPGINTVIASVTKAFVRHGYRVIGIHGGYKGLFSPNPEILELDLVISDQIFTLGGSVIRMSRFKPKDCDFNSDIFIQQGICLLVTIGGDDTASTANRLTKYLELNNIRISNIHVPKTIDNDLPLPNGVPTFGFSTAKEVAVNIGRTVKTESLTTGNWYLMMTMGREAGHLAFDTGMAIHSDMIIIPEMFNLTEITIDKILRLCVSSIVKKKLLGFNSGLTVVSEGIFHFLNDSDIAKFGIEFDYDQHGHPELSNFSKAHALNKLLRRRLEMLNISTISRPIEVGYSLRCKEPNAFDLCYCTSLGYGVRKLYEEGCTGCIITQTYNGDVVPLNLKSLEDESGQIRTRLVDMGNDSVKSTFAENIFYLTEEDGEKAKAILSDPENYFMSKILS